MYNDGPPLLPTCAVVDALGVDICAMLEEEGGHLQAGGVAGPQEGGPQAPVPRIHLQEVDRSVWFGEKSHPTSPL